MTREWRSNSISVGSPHVHVRCVTPPGGPGSIEAQVLISVPPLRAAARKNVG